MSKATVEVSEKKLRICEVYESLQGEGLLTGTPSTFVRTSGCNLRCWFCDTPFASWQPEGDYFTVEQVMEQISVLSPKHVVLTGGEPMIQSSVVDLARSVRDAGYHLTIETAGSVWQELECDLWSISPKLIRSAPPSDSGGWREAHDQRRHQPDVVRRMMRGDYQLKFVVDSLQDAEEVLAYLDDLGAYDRQRVLLMPQGIDVETLDQQARWLEPWCHEHDVRYCPRQHIYWYGNRRGT